MSDVIQDMDSVSLCFPADVKVEFENGLNIASFGPPRKLASRKAAFDTVDGLYGHIDCNGGTVFKTEREGVIKATKIILPKESSCNRATAMILAVNAIESAQEMTLGLTGGVCGCDDYALSPDTVVVFEDKD